MLDAFVEWVNPHYAFLLLLPWFILLINVNWPFQGFGTVDPWYYFGMSLDFPRYQHLELTYAGERLTWILPARLFVWLFSPVYGWMLFHICLWYVAVLLVYSVLRDVIGARGALLTAAMMGAHPLFLGSNGWAYLDGGSIAYLMCTVWVIWASRSARQPQAYLTLAGVFWAFTTYNYLLWWLFTPCCAVFYLIAADLKLTVRSTETRRRFGSAVVYFAVGIVIATVLLMFAQRWIYGRTAAFFFAKNVHEVLANLTLKRSQVGWGSQTYDWIPAAGWIVFPVVTFLISIVGLVRHFMGTRLPKIHIGLILIFCYAFMSMAYMTFRPNEILQFDYYASILIPLEFLVLGVLVFSAPPGLPKTFWSVVLAIGVCISVAPLWQVNLYKSGLGKNLLSHYIFALFALTPVLIRRRVWTWGAAVAGLSIASFGLIPAYPSNAWTFQYNGMAATRRVADAITLIDANTAAEALPVMWLDNYDSADVRTSEFRAIMCGLMSQMRSMTRYPEVDQSRKCKAGTELVLITKKEDEFEAANAKATAAGMPLKFRRQYMISGDGIDPAERVRYWITFTEVLPPLPVQVPNHLTAGSIR